MSYKQEMKEFRRATEEAWSRIPTREQFAGQIAFRAIQAGLPNGEIYGAMAGAGYDFAQGRRYMLRSVKEGLFTLDDREDFPQYDVTLRGDSLFAGREVPISVSELVAAFSSEDESARERAIADAREELTRILG